MRILFLDQFSEFGGAQLCLRDLLIEVQRRGWTGEVMAPGNGPLHDFCRKAGIVSNSLPVSSYSNGHKRAADMIRFPFDAVRSAAAVGRRIRDFCPDLIYVNGPRALPAAAGVDCPTVFHSHSLLAPGYSRWIADFCLRGGHTTIIAACQHVAQAFVNSPQPLVIYNGVEDQGFVARPRRESGFHVGIVGRIAPEKGQLDFVLAARQLARRNRDIRFSITGRAMFSNPGYEAEVRTAATGLPVEFRSWTGNVPELLHDLDVIVVPSSSIDATPRVVMEALSAGTPIVAFRSGGIEELLVDGETGVLAESGSPERLAAAIEALIADRGLMARLSVGGRQEWEARFRLDRYQRDICQNIQRSVLCARPTTARK